MSALPQSCTGGVPRGGAGAGAPPSSSVREGNHDAGVAAWDELRQDAATAARDRHDRVGDVAIDTVWVYAPCCPPAAPVPGGGGGASDVAAVTVVSGSDAAAPPHSVEGVATALWHVPTELTARWASEHLQWHSMKRMRLWYDAFVALAGGEASTDAPSAARSTTGDARAAAAQRMGHAVWEAVTDSSPLRAEAAWGTLVTGVASLQDLVPGTAAVEMLLSGDTLRAMRRARGAWDCAPLCASPGGEDGGGGDAGPGRLRASGPPAADSTPHPRRRRGLRAAAASMADEGRPMLWPATAESRQLPGNPRDGPLAPPVMSGTTGLSPPPSSHPGVAECVAMCFVTPPTIAGTCAWNAILEAPGALSTGARAEGDGPAPRVLQSSSAHRALPAAARGGIVETWVRIWQAGARGADIRVQVRAAVLLDFAGTEEDRDLDTSCRAEWVLGAGVHSDVVFAQQELGVRPGAVQHGGASGAPRAVPEWPLWGAGAGVPPPARNCGEAMHAPVLALLGMWPLREQAARRHIAAVWYAAWGAHLLPYSSLLVQLWRLATQSPALPGVWLPGLARMCARGWLDSWRGAGVAAASTGQCADTLPPDLNAVSAAGEVQNLLPIVLHQKVDCIEPQRAWWWHGAVPSVACRAAQLAAWSRVRVTAAHEGSAGILGEGSPQRLAALLNDAADWVWYLQAWGDVALAAQHGAAAGGGVHLAVAEAVGLTTPEDKPCAGSVARVPSLPPALITGAQTPAHAGVGGWERHPARERGREHPIAQEGIPPATPLWTRCHIGKLVLRRLQAPLQRVFAVMLPAPRAALAAPSGAEVASCGVDGASRVVQAADRVRAALPGMQQWIAAWREYAKADSASGGWPRVPLSIMPSLVDIRATSAAGEELACAQWAARVLRRVAAGAAVGSGARGGSERDDYVQLCAEGTAVAAAVEGTWARTHEPPPGLANARVEVWGECPARRPPMTGPALVLGPVRACAVQVELAARGVLQLCGLPPSATGGQSLGVLVSCAGLFMVLPYGRISTSRRVDASAQDDAPMPRAGSVEARMAHTVSAVRAAVGAGLHAALSSALAAPGAAAGDSQLDLVNAAAALAATSSNAWHAHREVSLSTRTRRALPGAPRSRATVCVWGDMHGYPHAWGRATRAAVGVPQHRDQPARRPSPGRRGTEGAGGRAAAAPGCVALSHLTKDGRLFLRPCHASVRKLAVWLARFGWHAAAPAVHAGIVEAFTPRIQCGQ